LLKPGNETYDDVKKRNSSEKKRKKKRNNTKIYDADFYKTNTEET